MPRVPQASSFALNKFFWIEEFYPLGCHASVSQLKVFWKNQTFASLSGSGKLIMVIMTIMAIKTIVAIETFVAIVIVLVVQTAMAIVTVMVIMTDMAS